MSDLTELEARLCKAVRATIKRRRGAVNRIVSAIGIAAWDANMSGRMMPAKDGQTRIQAIGTQAHFIAAAIRELERKESR